MNIFTKQNRKNPVFTVVMIILLSLAAAFFAMGYSAYSTAKLQYEKVSLEFVSIAVPKQPKQDDFSNRDAYIENMVNQIEAYNVAKSFPKLIGIDERAYLSAYLPGMEAVTSCSITPAEYNRTFDGNIYSLCVLAVKCTGIEAEQIQNQLSYVADFDVEEIISRSETFENLPELDTVSDLQNIFNADGSIPYEIGKNYLLFGSYDDYQVVTEIDIVKNHENVYIDEEKGYAQLRNQRRFFFTYPALIQQENSLIYTEKDGASYRYFDENITWKAEYDGDPWDFIESENGRIWREEILPMCEINQCSAPVILTDSIKTAYSFNTGATTLIEGRYFTLDEYKQGKPVCIVSASFAELNGLSVGDKVEMEFYYDKEYGNFTIHTNGGSTNSIFGGNRGAFIERTLMHPDAAIGFSDEYEIVGIYSGERFPFGTYLPTADTIYAPKNSVPGAENYIVPNTPFLNSFIVENGKTDEFEQYISEQGYPDMFIYNDQGFSEMEETLLALEANAKRMMTLGIGVMVLVSVLFFFLNFRRMMPVIRGVRLLGKPAKKTRNEILAVLFVQEVLSVIIGTILAAVFFGTVTSSVLSEAVTLDAKNLVFIAAVLLCILTAVSFLLAGIFSEIRLIKRK